MSAFVVMVPMLMGGPAFVAAAAVAGAALGLSAVGSLTAEDESKVDQETSVEVGVPNSHGLASTVDEGDFLTLEGKGFQVMFRKTGRGECLMRVDGKGKSKAELEVLGKDLLNRIAQQYAYEKLSKELKKKGFKVVQEKVEQDRTIRLTVKKGP